MQSFRLNTGEHLLKINPKKYKIKVLQQLKEQVNASKSLLDRHYKNPNFLKAWHKCDPFRTEKDIVARIGNTCNVTNAWLKCYELIIHYELCTGKVLHFDNAAFPGSFILGTHHYAKTHSIDYQWFGSSLLSVIEQNSKPLSDKYRLYQNYPDHWLMNKNNDGDVLKVQNQLDMHKFFKAKGGVTLYTSDLGFDVSSDYNNQELLHAKANIGQILAGLLTLSRGGHFVTKQYSTFESITISIIYIASTFFEEFYISKPATSKAANSEIYLVGKKFKGDINTILENDYIRYLFKLLESRQTTDLMPAFENTAEYEPFIKQLISISNEIFKKQINTLQEQVKISLSQSTDLDKYLVEQEDDIIEWYKTNQILPIEDHHRLKMYNAYKQ